MKTSWKTLSSKLIYQNKFIKFFLNEVIQPGGKVAQYPVIERRSSVVIIPVGKDNSVSLIKQYRYILGKKYLELPAGYIEEGETPLITAKRELAEEVHLKANKWIFLGASYMTASVFKAKHNFFLATDLEEKHEKGDPTEEITIIKKPLHDIIDLIMKKKIENGPTVTGILLAEKFLKGVKL